MFSNILMLFSVFLLISCDDNVNICENFETPCVCNLPGNRYINLTTLVSPKNSQQKDSFFQSKTNDKNPIEILYYFNGCYDGRLQPEHINANLTGNLISTRISGSESNTTKYDAHVEGRASSMQFKLISDEYYIVLSENNSKNTTIQLYCVKNAPNSILYLNVNTLKLSLWGPHSCILQKPDAGGLSGGSTLLIIFIISLSVYLIGGAAVLYFMRGARGIELVPNLDFWRRLPGLVRDGTIFLLSGCKTHNLNTTSESYDQI